MTNPCRLFATEYSRQYVRHKLKPSKTIIQDVGFDGRIEEGEIDPLTASIPTKLDDAAEQLVYKHILDNLQSVYQVTYKDPWLSRQKKRHDEEEVKEEVEEKDLGSELIAYIHGLYFNPHDEKVLTLPVTAKRMLGYVRPKLLHGDLSMYQDTIGRTAATIIMQEHGKDSNISGRQKTEKQQ